ncbi:MAG TPA: hypothetical protein DCS05_04215 [Nitrospiraceae bacterium]|nr:hypothetical protein [Nitrospiraceae bacterium]
MDNTVTVTLTVDDQGSVKVLNFKKNLEGAGDATEKTGKQTEAGRLGFFALGNVVEDAARSMGVAGQASRQLGNSVERTAASAFPMWGAALGVATLAGTAIIAMIGQLIESQRKEREEVLKAGVAAEQWIQTTYKNQRQTEELTAAIRRQTEARRDEALFNLGEKQALDKDTLIEKQRKLNAVVEEYNRLRAGKGDDMSTGYDAIAEGRLQAQRDKLQREISTLKSDIDVQTQRLLQGTGDIPQGTSPAYDKMFGPSMEDAQAYYAKQMAAESAHLTAVDDLWSTQNKNYQGHLDMQLAIFDTNATARLTALSASGASEQQLRDAFATESLGKERLRSAESIRIKADETARKKAFEDMTWNYGTQIAVGLTALAAQHGKKDAEEQKKSARMMAIVNTAAGITKAFATKGWAGAYEAALIAAVGLIQISTINSASYGGGGGTSLNFGGGSAAPAYQTYYEQDPKNPQNYGTGWRPGEGGGSNSPTYNLNNSIIIAQDSGSFNDLVGKAAAANYNDQGDLHTAVNG